MDIRKTHPFLFLNKGTTRVFFGVSVLLAGFLILLASVPPVSRDAMTHHLAVPDLYLRHGKMVELPHLSFSYYPMNLDLLYWAALAVFGRDIIPKYIHLAFGLMTFCLVFFHVKPRAGRGFALLGAFLFLSLPVVMHLAITAYVDLGLVFFSFGAMMLLIRFFQGGFNPWMLAGSAACCGLGLGVKYNGILVLILLAVAAAIIPAVKLGKQTGRILIFKPVLYACIFVAISLAVFSPWMIRNAKWTGNPVYPMATSVFGPQNQVSESPRVSHFQLRRHGYGEPWWQIALAPVRIFFEGKDDDPRLFDGRLNCYLLLLPLAAMAGLGRDPLDLKLEKIFFAVFSFCYILMAFLGRDLRMRYLGPILPPLAVLSVYGLGEILYRAKQLKGGLLPKLAKAGTWAVVGAMVCMNLAYAASLYSSVRPLDYLSRKLTRDQYISARFPVYPVYQFINARLDEKAIILALFLGGKGYYCRREIWFDHPALVEAVRHSSDPNAVYSHLKKHGITHLLIRVDLFNNWVKNNFTSQNGLVFRNFMEQKARLLYKKPGIHAV